MKNHNPNPMKNHNPNPMKNHNPNPNPMKNHNPNPMKNHTALVHSPLSQATGVSSHLAKCLKLSCAVAIFGGGLSIQASTVGYWSFEQGSFTEDSSSNGLDLTLGGTAPNTSTQYTLPASGAGSAFFNPVPQTGQANVSALSRAGAGNYYYHDDSAAFAPGTGLTIEALAHLSGGTGGRTIASQGGNGTDSSWAFVVGTNGNLFFQYQSATGNWGDASLWQSLDSGVQITVGKDFYVGFTFNISDTSPTGAVFYIQNLTDDLAMETVSMSHTYTTLHDSSNRFIIGSTNGGNAPWDGYLDEVRLSNTQLAQSELLVAVPEPLTALPMAGLALLIAGFMRPRRVRIET